MTDIFKNNQSSRRYELDVDGEIAYATYHVDGQTLYIDYVEAPLALRGTGAAGRLMEHIVADAKGRNYSITPICGYAASWLRRRAG